MHKIQEVKTQRGKKYEKGKTDLQYGQRLTDKEVNENSLGKIGLERCLKNILKSG